MRAAYAALIIYDIIIIMSIIVKDLVFKYEDSRTNAIDGISFTINDNEWVSIIGHNGSGKSTLAKILMGILEKKSGDVNMFSYDLTEDNMYDIRRHIGIVHQNPDNQFVSTIVKDDIAFGLENLCIESNKMDSIIDDALAKVSMTNFKERDVSSLSGGERQKIAISSILAMNLDTIIFDESTSMLDPYSRDEIISLIKELKRDGKTIIMITHDMAEALMSDRCIVLSKGKIIKDDIPEKVLTDTSVLTLSNLESPRVLYLFNKLKEEGYDNKEVLDALWQLTLKM